MATVSTFNRLACAANGARRCAAQHKATPRVFAGAVLLALAASCDAGPIELRYASDGTDDQRDRDLVGTPEPAVDSSIDVDAGTPSGFVIGPACEEFPNPCSLAGREKCTLVSNDPGYRSSCVPESGELPIGAECERRVRGDDDCAPAGFCTPFGRGFEHENRLICRRLCASSEQCEVGQRCAQLLSAEQVGVCVDECTVFRDGCVGEGLRCAAVPDASGGFFGYCEIFGSVEEGDECTLTSQCGDGMSCELSERRCRYSCDDAHPCPEELERRCLPLELGVSESLRICLP